MVCLFCSSDHHKSNSCGKYKTDEERKMIPNSERFCFTCQFESDAAHLPKNKNCKSNENCIGWHSTEHHELFCAERIKALASNLFLPKIDQNLMPRFFETLEIDEKYSIAFSSPKAADLIPLKPIKIFDSFENGNKFSDLNVIIRSMLLDIFYIEAEKKLYNSIKSKTIICLAKTIRIEDSKLSAEMILQLFSPYTIKFYIFRSRCNPRLSFTDIIKKAPNLEDFYAYDSSENIVYEKTWIKDLLKFKTGKNFTSLIVNLDTVEMDVENLVKFIKTKCNKKVARIIISFSKNTFDDENGQIFAEIIRKLSEYLQYSEGEESYLRIGNETFSLEKFKQPQQEIMPSRVAKKRKHFE